MERLTKKEWVEWSEDEDICSISEDADYLTKCYQKLGKLEDIEEELGISLEVLFKALKEGIYRRNGYIDYVYLDYALLEKKYCLITADDRVFYLKDYRVTWSLTKEELE